MADAADGSRQICWIGASLGSAPRELDPARATGCRGSVSVVLEPSRL
ncbi:MAG: hypothetical protein WBN89_10780 [Prochlorococcaceae cyanobacterium]